MMSVLSTFVFTALVLSKVSGLGDKIINEKYSLAAYKKWATKFGNEEQADNFLNSERYKIFRKNLQFISNKPGKEDPGYGMELNKFAALSDKEMDSYIGINMTDVLKMETLSKRQSLSDSSDIPHSIDYRRTLGLSLTRSVDLIHCRAGSWAYSVVAALEGQYKILTDEILQLSEEQLLDCSYSSRHGCKGGYMDAGFKYVKKVNNLSDRRLYMTSNCQGTLFHNALARAVIEEYSIVTAGDDNLRRVVSDVGPVSAGIYAKKTLFFYKYGIYDLSGHDCPASKDINHAVTVVGYKPNLWILRNCWGPDWGLGGYFYLTRNVENNCKISTVPISVKMIKTDNADDHCPNVQFMHRQPCWHETTKFVGLEAECKKRDCCWDAAYQYCFVKAKITLYLDRYFQGPSATFYGSVRDLAPYGISKLALSLKVHYGEFIVYNHEDFGETGKSWNTFSLGILRPGEVYDDLDEHVFARDIASIRALPTAPDIISLFKHSGGIGEVRSYFGSFNSVGDEYNDMYSSSFSTGNWEVCRHAYGRDCKEVKGFFRNLGDIDMNDAVSGVQYLDE